MASTSKGQRKTQDPCPKCLLHKERCICAFIPKLWLRTRLTLLIHHRELRRTTNTGLLAVHALPNSQMIVRGRGPIEKGPLDLKPILADPLYQCALLFPSPNAIELSALNCDRPVHLLVPDGNWRQASKVGKRHPELAGIPHVVINSPNSERAHLRAESTAHGRSTLHAIADALGVLESSEVRAQLMQLYHLKLQRTLEGRGLVNHLIPIGK